MSLSSEENRRRSVAVWMITLGTFAVVFAGFSIVTALVTGDFHRWLIWQDPLIDSAMSARQPQSPGKFRVLSFRPGTELLAC